MMCPHSKTADGFEMQLGVNHLGESCCSLTICNCTFINLLKYFRNLTYRLATSPNPSTPGYRIASWLPSIDFHRFVYLHMLMMRTMCSPTHICTHVCTHIVGTY